MKKNLFYPGGHRAKVEDLDHLQNALIQATEVLAEAAGGEFISSSFPLILTGCNYTGGSTGPASWASGFVLWNSEIFFIHEQAADITAEDYDFFIEEVFLTGNPVLYKDGTPRNVHAIRSLRGKDTGVEGGPGEFPVTRLNPSELLNIAQGQSAKLIDRGSLISRLLTANIEESIEDNGYININTPGGGIWDTGSNYFIQPKVKKAGQLVKLRGQVVLTGGTTLFTLPSGYRPVNGQAFRDFSISSGHGNTSGAIWNLTIRGDGLTTIELNAQAGGTFSRIFTLDTIQFWI